MKHILLILASEDMRVMLQETLGGRYVVTACEDAGEGLNKMQLGCDLLVVDLILPGMDGISLLQAAAENRPKHIIAVTPLISGDILQTLSDMAIDYVIRKPCSLDIITKHIDALLNKDPLPVGRG